MTAIPPEAINQIMQDFLENLKSLQNEITNLASQDSTATKNLETCYQKTQEFFQTQLANQTSADQIPADQIPADQIPADQIPVKQISARESNLPYCVEINKQLRLFGADLQLIKTARRPETLNLRLNQAQNRLTLILSYCKNIS